jgi:hypothetical protein
VAKSRSVGEGGGREREREGKSQPDRAKTKTLLGFLVFFFFPLLEPRLIMPMQLREDGFRTRDFGAVSKCVKMLDSDIDSQRRNALDAAGRF